MNDMRCRLGMIGLLALSAAAHAAASFGTPNTPEGMFAFHLLAALIDVVLFLTASAILKGALCRDTQIMLLASAAGNVVGWLLYMAYVSPSYYNIFMWSLTAAQVLRLFYVADGDQDEPVVIEPHFLERTR